MIAEFFAGLAMDFAIWIATLFPDWELPAFLTDSRGTLVSMIQTHAGLGVWVDWGVLNLCVAAVVGTYVVVVAIKLIRALIGHVPQIGGKGD